VNIGDAAIDTTDTIAFLSISMAFENNGKVPTTVLAAEYSVVGRITKPASPQSASDKNEAVLGSIEQ
jgi:hypothetical protein